MHAKFEGVKGYASYERAKLRGEVLEAQFKGTAEFEYRWVVIALPSGRFTPCVILNNSIPGGPGMFLGENNVCVIN